MKTFLFFAALAIGLSSCAGKKTLKVERLEGQIQQIDADLSMNKVGDTIIVKDVYSSGYGSSTYYYGNFRGEMPETWYDTDSSGRMIYSVFYATAVVRDVCEE